MSLPIRSANPPWAAKLTYGSCRRDDIDEVNKHIAKAAIRLLQQRNTAPFDRVTEVSVGNSITISRLLNTRPLTVFVCLRGMQDALAKGLEQRPPCRFETFDVQCNGKSVQVVLDIGHNPPAVTTLVAKAKGHARRCGKGIRMIVGMSRDKDIPSSLHMLAEITSKEKISFVQASHPRATPVPVLQAILHGRSFGEADVRAAVDDDHTRRTVHEQLQLCAENNEILLVCGTAFIMAEVRAAIGIVEPRVR